MNTNSDDADDGGASASSPYPEHPALVVERITTLQRFEAVRLPWNDLADRVGPFPMARHEWLVADARALAHRELAVFVAWEDGRLRAALPLAVQRDGPIRRLVWISGQMVEPETILHDSFTALSMVWDAARRRGMSLYIRRLEVEPIALRLIERAYPSRGTLVLRRGTTQTVSAPVANWWAFEAGISRSSKGNLRRQRVALERHGPVTFHAHSPTAEELPALMAELLRIEAAGWKSMTRSAIVYRPSLAAFLREYAQRTAEQGTLRMFFLAVGGRNIAAQLLVEGRARLWQFKIGYDEEWAKYSPGKLLMLDILRWASEHGLEKVEYLGLGGAWQTRWPSEATEQHTVRFYPHSLGGAVAFSIDAGRFALRKLRREQAGLPPSRQERV